MQVISVDYKELIYNHGIQTANYIFVIGLIGIYKLLIYQNIDRFHILTIINLLSLFPPLVGLRMILKPEIMAFAFAMANLFNYSLQKNTTDQILIFTTSNNFNFNKFKIKYYINDWIYDLNLFWQRSN